MRVDANFSGRAGIKSQEDMPKRWRIHPHDPDRILALERAAGVPAVVAQLLICRGIHDPLLARQFLECKLSDLRPPELLPGVPEAAERIAAAVAARRRIVIYGDYDVDGMTGTALLWQCLKLLGGDVGYYLPCRIQEGYGLNHEALRALAAQGTQMVITVDCGIASIDEALTARELGLELIVTDHHEMAASLPDAAVCVHPRLPGSSYPFGGLSGAGVAFKLAWAVCQQAHGARKVSEAMKNFLLQAVALTALGTVADVVPLTDENRIIVRHGLTSLKNRPLLGLATLIKVAGLEGKSRLECEDIGFTLAPRLNAAGRLGQAQLAVELLTTSSAERATALAEYISELNITRQSLERSIYLAANKQAREEFDPENDSALVLAGRGWHPGVIGIVAGRLAEKFNRPVVLISLDELSVKPASGSARSVHGFDLHRALAACSQHLLSHGGHAAAAGLKIEERCLAAFREDFREVVAAEICDSNGTPELWIDAEAPLSAFTMQAVDHLERLAPFGQGNTRPMWCATGVNLCEPPRKIGGGERHLSLRLEQHGVRLRAVAFGGGDWLDELTARTGPLSFAFRPMINEFNGRRRVELQIMDWQAATAAMAESAAES
jgi:single-stranded-DNA-specific exonuclease